MIMLTHGMTGALIRASSRDGGQQAGANGAADSTSGGPLDRSRDRSTASGDVSAKSVDGIVAALASVPDELSRLLANRSREDLTQPAQDGGWGIVEILPHFHDWERVIRDRVDRILTEETPELEEHDDSLWAIEHDYSSQDPLDVLAAFREQREALVELLESLDEAAWDRDARLPKHGRITLHWLLNNVCDHDARHMMQVRDVLA